jgi:hypothetical protein
VNPSLKRFKREFEPIADAVARLDLDQEVREQIADALTDALDGRADFRPDLFWHLTADPLCECAGTDEGPCPEGRSIRISMHLRDAPDGRSRAWQPRKPTVRCVSCGARQVIHDGGTT